MPTPFYAPAMYHDRPSGQVWNFGGLDQCMVSPPNSCPLDLYFFSTNDYLVVGIASKQMLVYSMSNYTWAKPGFVAAWLPDIPFYPNVPSSSIVPRTPGSWQGGSLQLVNGNMLLFGGKSYFSPNLSKYLLLLFYYQIFSHPLSDHIIAGDQEQWIFEPITKQWIFIGPLTSLNLPKIEHTTWVLGNYVYIFGGVLSDQSKYNGRDEVRIKFYFL